MGMGGLDGVLWAWNKAWASGEKRLINARVLKTWWLTAQCCHLGSIQGLRTQEFLVISHLPPGFCGVSPPGEY